MRTPFILSIYIIKQFLSSIGTVLAVLAGIILLFDAMETFRRTQGKNAPLNIVIEMLIMKLPSLIIEVLPFVILIAAILTFSRLTRSSELISARAAGISVWQFLTPVILFAFAVGSFFIAVFNPLSATMLSRFEKIEAKYVHGTTSMLSVSSSGLWLNQYHDQNKAIIHALRVSNSDMKLFDVTIFLFTNNNDFYQRIDANSAKLHENGYWEISDATFTTPGKSAEKKAIYLLPTNLSPHQIQDSFAHPETISFWKLPDFIDSLKNAGFSALNHSLYWHKTLALPFFLSTMVLFAAVFSLHPPRKGKTGILIISGIVTGLVIRFLTDLVSAIGLSGSIPIIIAAWTPTLICLLLGIVLVLHFEDG